MEDDRKYLPYLARKIRNVQNIVKLNEKELEERIKAIDDLFVFMEVRKLDSNEIREELDKFVESIYYSEMKGLQEEFSEIIPLYMGNEAEGDFYGEYANGKYIKINTNLLYEFLKSPDFDTRMDGCEEIVRTIAHEIQHHRQYIMATREVSSKEALMFGKDFAMHNILGKEYYDYNYNNLGTENDANEIAEKKKMEARGDDRKAKINMLQHKMMKIAAQYEVNDVETFDGQKYDIVRQDKEEITDEVLDKEICINKNIWLLYEYPILQKVYNEDGTKKGTKQLVNEMEREKEELLNNQFLTHEEAMQAIYDSEDMYLDLIYKSLTKTTKRELKQIGRKKLNEILNKIERKFEDEAEELIDIGEDCKDLKNEEADEMQGRMSFVHKFFRKRSNRADFLYLENKAYYKLKSQKKVIRQARRGKVPRKPINPETQALKIIRPIDKLAIKINNFINKMNYNIKKVIEPIKYRFLEFNIKYRKVDIPERQLEIDDEKTEQLNNKENEFKSRIKAENWKKDEINEKLVKEKTKDDFENTEEPKER